jgi:hypothetical protein
VVCYALAIVVASQRVRLDLTALIVEQYCQYARRERTGSDDWPESGRAPGVVATAPAFLGLRARVGTGGEFYMAGQAHRRDLAPQ